MEMYNVRYQSLLLNLEELLIKLLQVLKMDSTKLYNASNGWVTLALASSHFLLANE